MENKIKRNFFSVTLTTMAVVAATACAAQAAPQINSSESSSGKTAPTQTTVASINVTNATTVPLAPANSSPSLQTVTNVFNTMKSTTYSHHYVIQPQNGVYQWDCVGLTDWILSKSAPNAWKNMHTTLNIKKGYVPTPDRWVGYLRGTLPASWQRIQKVSLTKPGDYILSLLV